MWREILWWHDLPDAEVARRLSELRADSLRLVLRAAVVAYLVWHFARNYESGLRGLEHWPLLPLAAAALAATHLLLRRSATLATWFALLAAAVVLTAAVWLLGAQEATAFIPLLALVAVVLLYPLAGLVVVAFALGLLLLLRQAAGVALPPERLAETGLVSLFTVVVAWTLARNMATAVDWSARSYAEAWRKTQEARANRAELVKALKQLDHAYYALQRANAALELAWKAADDAERARSEFVANISHELRTPLNLIVGFSEMMLTSPETYRAPLPPAYRGDLHAIYRSAQHLLTLTNDVIDLARVGMGRLAIVREPVDLAQVIADACALVQQYVDAKRLTLQVQIPAPLPTLHLDRLRIRQVLLNLLTNAARFTERGGITVSATVEGGGSEVLVRVSDTGRGIAPEDLDKVFREFYSAGGRASPGRDLGGVGLGLPLSRRLIELHGGQMGVESQPGAGSTFWFRLPAVHIEGAGRGEQGNGWPRSRGAAEDEALLVLAGADEAAHALLQRHLPRHRLVRAADFDQAVATAVELRALAILTDLDPPPAREAPVPVFRLPLPHGERLAAELGAAAYLTKPIIRAALYRAIASLGRPVQTILLVDDDPRFLRLLTRMIQAAPGRPGYTVHTAHNGQEALASMASMRPDLVVLDLVMPELDGRATLAAMRQEPALAGVPVIIISAQDQLKAQFPLPGALAIRKGDGLQLEELLGVIEAVLGVLRPPQAYLTAAKPDPSPT